MDAKQLNESSGPRGIVRRLFTFMFAMAVAGPACAGDYRIAPPARWVEHMAPDDAASPPGQQVSQGVHHLLSDVQSRIDGDTQSSYRHFASKALNGQGVESVAHVEIPLDPSYQRLDIHAVNIRRQGAVIARLPTANIKVLQREKELESLIYDGRKTVNVFIEDVRIGDIVEYAYTVHGAHPAFAGQHFGRFDMQWQVPVQRFSYRLLWPQGRPVRIEHLHTSLRPRERDIDGFREYRWQAERLAPLTVDAEAPAWFDPYPAVQYSEFKDWAAVARWATPLYRTPDTLGPALQEEVRRIAREADAPADRLLRVLRFVQKDIRYLGVEVGVGSYQPSAPDTVLQRRFGDCKDKTLLTMAMLRALGIDAHAALVNTRIGRGVQALIPMPGAFNHVIVVARVEGREYWLDPTRAPQNSALDKLYQPDFEMALVVSPHTRGLRDMVTEARRIRRTVNATIDARDSASPARYTIVTVVEGSDAESLRYRLASENRDETEKRYLNYYARRYPGLQVSSPMSIDDEVGSNRITTTERYLIPELWKRSQERSRLEAAIEVPDLDEALRYPSNTVRSAPLQLVPMLDLAHTTEVQLPGDWTIKPETMNVDDPAFGFRRAVALSGRTLTITDHFQSHADHVAAQDTARYAASMERARSHLNYLLYQSDVQGASAAGRPSGLAAMNWPIALLALVSTGLWTWLAMKIYRHDPPRPARAAFSPEPGIGGWLILAALGVVLTPLRLLHQIGKADLAAFGLPTWTALTTPGGEHYHALWAPVLLLEMVGSLGMLVMSLLVVVMFFQKRFTLPPLFIKFHLAVLGYLVLDAVLLQMIPMTAQNQDNKEMAQLLRAVIVSVIWILYFWRSERVKTTFVKGLPGRAQAERMYTAVPR